MRSGEAGNGQIALSALGPGAATCKTNAAWTLGCAAGLPAAVKSDHAEARRHLYA